MEQRILTTQFGVSEAAPWDGTNRSGIRPLCDKVLVLCDLASEKVGNLLMPGTVQENQSLASTTGVMVACGEQAFAYDSDRLVRWEGDRPAAGSRIFFQKYAGQEYTGSDGRLYRLMQDRSIAGVEIQPGE